MTDAERLARRILHCTESTGIEMMKERGVPDRELNPRWEMHNLTRAERDGLIRAAKMLLDRGYVVLGPNA